jgi:hypothetical protein
VADGEVEDSLGGRYTPGLSRCAVNLIGPTRPPR